MDALTLIEAHIATLPDSGERYAKTPYSTAAVRGMVEFARKLEVFHQTHPHPTRAQARDFISAFGMQQPLSVYRYTDGLPGYHTLAGKLLYGDFQAFQQWYCQEWSNVTYTIQESQQYPLSAMQRTIANAVSRLNYLGDY